jgi:hypothetical protein
VAASQLLEQVTKDIFIRHMGGNLVLRLNVTIVSLVFFLYLVVCLSFRQRLRAFHPKPMYCFRDVIKFSVSNKNEKFSLTWKELSTLLCFY